MPDKSKLIERLRAVRDAQLTPERAHTIDDAIAAIESLRRQLGEQQREAARDARAAADERSWQDRNDRDGVPHGTY